VTVRIPPGTAGGRRLRVRGRGVAKANGSRGDLIVTVEVTVPQRLSAKARSALEEFAAAAPDDPRDNLRRLVESA
jgi:molecular chaperone DnaJ